MARMYPDIFNAENKPNPSEAEQEAYEALRDQLDDSYVVFHGKKWHGLNIVRDNGSVIGSRRRRTGEADFVIAHPEHGILILEVKGGEIRLDQRTGTWYSKDRYGNEHRLDKSPFDQAEDSKYVLRDLIDVTLRFSPDAILAYAVAFPNTTVPNRPISLNIARDIVLDEGDLADVPSWVKGVFAYWAGNAPVDKAANAAAFQVIIDDFVQPVSFRPALWGRIRKADAEVVRLTAEQLVVLDELEAHSRVAISGCAGSGKTMLAVEKASRLAKQGYKVLLTCYNKPLAEELRRTTAPQPNLEITNFQALCFDWAQRAGIALGEPIGDHFFNVELPNSLLEAANRLPQRYDAIIVDEGRDFYTHWFAALSYLLADPDNGVFYVFYDDNQDLYARDFHLPFETPPVYLTQNCRNTPDIHNVVTDLYRGEKKLTCRPRKSLPVEIGLYKRNSSMAEHLMLLLYKLIKEEHIPANEIVVLTPTSSQTMLQSVQPYVGIKLGTTWPPRKDEVFYTTLFKFKGLECKVAVLVEMERDQSTDERELRARLYVACSRARDHLVILLPEDDKKIARLIKGAKRVDVSSWAAHEVTEDDLYIIEEPDDDGVIGTPQTTTDYQGMDQAIVPLVTEEAPLLPADTDEVIVACIRSLAQPVGKFNLAYLLAGSGQSNIKKESSEQYGLLAPMAVGEVARAVNNLVIQGRLRNVVIADQIVVILNDQA